MNDIGDDQAATPDSLPVLQGDRETGPHTVGSDVTIRSIKPIPGRDRVVGFAVAGLVLRDDDEATVVASISGSEKAERDGARGGPRGRNVIDSLWNGSYDLGVWDGETVVRVHRRGQCWSIWRWHDGREWSSTWYGNLEAPWRRTEIGYDTQDWTLDVVAEGVPGTEDWTVKLKDEDELEWFVSQGAYSSEQATSIRQIGQILTHSLRHTEGTDDQRWSAWTPPRGAQPASLADSWQMLT